LRVLVECVGVAPTRTDRREAATPSDGAETGNGLTAADPEGGVRVANPGPVERLRHDRDLVVPDEHLVDDRRADDAVPVGGHVAKWRIREISEPQRECPLR